MSSFYWLLLAIINDSHTTNHCRLRFQIKSGILGRIRAVFVDDSRLVTTCLIVFYSEIDVPILVFKSITTPCDRIRTAETISCQSSKQTFFFLLRKVFFGFWNDEWEVIVTIIELTVF